MTATLKVAVSERHMSVKRPVPARRQDLLAHSAAKR
jgi:hypothetical protein